MSAPAEGRTPKALSARDSPGPTRARYDEPVPVGGPP